MNDKDHGDEGREPSTVVETTPTMHQDKIEERREILARAEALEGGAPYPPANNPTRPIEIVEPPEVRGLRERVDTQGQLLAAQDLQLSELQRKHEELREALNLQQRINQNNDLIDSTVARMLEQLKRELGGLDERIQGWSERWSGQKVRIDRVLGTVDDLLQRVDGWKEIANELTQRLADHHKVINIHTKMFDDQIAANEQLKEFMTTARETLVNLEQVLDIRPRTMEPSDEPEPDPGKT